jgi:hypothetical protein
MGGWITHEPTNCFSKRVLPIMHSSISHLNSVGTRNRNARRDMKCDGLRRGETIAALQVLSLDFYVKLLLSCWPRNLIDYTSVAFIPMSSALNVC